MSDSRVKVRQPKGEGRLQRPMSSSGDYVTSLSQVLRRHGLVMGTLALMLLLWPGSIKVISELAAPLLSDPAVYLFVSALILVFFVSYWFLKSYRISAAQFQWVAYLFFISVVEEIAFRALLPFILTDAAGLTVAIFLSNLVFAGVHYVTLRWKIINCIGALIDGLALSRLLSNTGDIALVVLVHWLVTFLNTPSAPKKHL